MTNFNEFNSALSISFAPQVNLVFNYKYFILANTTLFS